MQKSDRVRHKTFTSWKGTIFEINGNILTVRWDDWENDSKLSKNQVELLSEVKCSQNLSQPY